jgi:hypothetical protein
MTPQELLDNFYNVCYYYACSGDALLNLPHDYTVSDEGSGPYISSWSYSSPAEPTEAQLLAIGYTSFQQFMLELAKQDKIRRIQAQDTYPLWVDIYNRSGLNVVTIMNQIF